MSCIIIMFASNVISRVIHLINPINLRKMMMTPEAKAKLKNMLVQDEGCKNFPYTDITGNLSIGVGRNLITRGISTNEALYLLDDDIIYFTSKLNYIIPFFSSLDENRKIV